MSSFRKAFLPLLVVALGIAFAALLVVFKRHTEPEVIEHIPPLVRVVEAVPASHQFIVASQGTVSPRRDIQLVAEVPGRVISISSSLAAGGFFDESETLVVIDPRDFELARVRAASQVSQAELRVAREKAEAGVALQEWKDLGQDRGEPSPLLLRKPQLAEAEAALAAAQAELSQAELDLGRTRLQAPFPGRVWEKKVDVGQYVTPGASLGRLYAVDVAEVRLPVSLPDLAFLDLPLDFDGTKRDVFPLVQLQATIAGKTNRWEGEIVRIEGEVDPRSRMITLVCHVIDPYNRSQTRASTTPLPVGLFVSAEIMGRAMDNTFSLPRVALRDGNRIIIVDQNNLLRFRSVEVLRSDRHRVIVGAGLNPGDRVSISLLDTPAEGMEVRVDDDSAARQAPRPRREKEANSGRFPVLSAFARLTA